MKRLVKNNHYFIRVRKELKVAVDLRALRNLFMLAYARAIRTAGTQAKFHVG